MKTGTARRKTIALGMVPFMSANVDRDDWSSNDPIFSLFGYAFEFTHLSDAVSWKLITPHSIVINDLVLIELLRGMKSPIIFGETLDAVDTCVAAWQFNLGKRAPYVCADSVKMLLEILIAVG